MRPSYKNCSGEVTPPLHSETIGKGHKVFRVKGKKKYITGLDIGTTKICAIIGEMSENNELSILGVGSSPSHGLKQGMVVDIESTVNSIINAVEKAEKMANVEVKKVNVGIAGRHIQSLNTVGAVAISNPLRGVVERDVKRALHKARSVVIPLEREIIHEVIQDFEIDGQKGIQNPIGMSGSTLKVNLHLITGSASITQNIINCVEQAGFKTSTPILESYASSLSLLDESERDLGVLLIDIGGGSADIAIFSGGCIKHTSGVDYAGDQITKDISEGLRTSKFNAENIKKRFGCAMAELVNEDEEFVVERVVDNKAIKVSKSNLSMIIEARMEEIFELVKRDTEKVMMKERVIGGVVLTGGTSLLLGIERLAGKIFNLPVRLGKPKDLKGMSSIVLSPIYSTSVGLVLYGCRDSQLYPWEKKSIVSSFVKDIVRAVNNI